MSSFNLPKNYYLYSDEVLGRIGARLLSMDIENTGLPAFVVFLAFSAGRLSPTAPLCIAVFSGVS